MGPIIVIDDFISRMGVLRGYRMTGDRDTL